MLGYFFLVLYAFIPYFANLAITYVGPVPVGFGYQALAGVYVAGLSFSLRDYIQEEFGKGMTILAILCGTAISASIDVNLAAASGAAFFLGEILDFIVYTPLKDRNHVYWAVSLSNTVGLVVDSICFLYLAKFSFDFLPGQILGKLEVTIATLAIIIAVRTFFPRYTINSGEGSDGRPI